MIKQPAHIEKIPAYKPGKSTVDGWDGPVYKLSSNENPYPPLPSVIQAITEAASTMHRYPNMAAPELTTALATRLGVKESELAFGTGSVEVAGQLIRAFAGHGDEVMYAWRSFEAYPILVRGAGATPVEVPLTADHRHDLPAMLAAITPATKVVFICTPNNPTGTAVGHEELRAFLAQVPAHVLVVIDEAYVHFQNDPAAARGLELYREFANVAVLHTFSKAYGLAALRLGYTVARPDVMEGLAKVALPFGVTDIAQAAGVASLAAEAELQDRIDVLLDERTKLEAYLATTKWDAPASQANFVWLAAGEETDELQAHLMSRGIIGRAFTGTGIRISVGSEEANLALVEALSSYSRG
ncbi:histidinol-phosphate aminotransferase [Aurantimicrobium minutum]|uniref:histidinol-phosphate transaminase n=1 Tax=Aurantimicrobium minutum TaxID=708131 RepID=UPI002473388D|nr:histidinol-phosphate transaminase [Aurantimicrobium minutum]MDH6531921.1 histidinol-phosphate aminotransferase [Aurantimicrobium minutum]